MKITLEELAPYLPYRLQVCFEGGDEKYEMVQLSTNYKGVGLVSENYGDFGESRPEDVRPILRPLSDLEPGMFDEEAEDLIGRIIKGHTVHYGSLSYTTIQYLSKNHYDFQNLIMKGLAVDINIID